ncbi:MAG: 30S ribosomal protein S8 [Candidatus Zambryskibacteria bacterium]|nr:30S ribosomal protein S8 [Candidatus Zambryskibacteria bacterium]
MNDPIGDFIIRVKNASIMKKEKVSVPFSNLKLAIAELLSVKNYLGNVSQKSRGSTKSLEVELLYQEDGKPVISEVKRISKPSRRLYTKAKDIKIFKKGFGMSIFSTPEGIRTDVDAKKENLGGEHLFNIW